MDGVMADCNAALEDILGEPRDRLIGFKMRSEIRDEGMAVAIARAFAGTSSAFEGAYTTVLSNRKIALRAIFTPLFGRDGGQTGVLFIAENITERKRTEDLLRESESRYKAIVESQAEFVVRYQPGGILTFINDTLCRYLDMKREDLLGRSYYPFMHPDDRGAFVAKIEALDRSNPSMLAEARVVLPDGKVVWHRWTHHAIFDDGDKPIEYQSTGGDVTELKETEDRLRESEELYRQLYEAESDAIFLIDNERGRILMANSAAAALYGYSVEELLAMENAALSAEPVGTRKVTTDTPVLRDSVVNIPLRYHRKKDGTVFPVEITGRFFLLGNRSVHISAVRDITGRKRAEGELREKESTYRTLFEAANDGIFIQDRNGFRDCNQRGAEMYGLTKEEIIGRSPAQFAPERQPDGRLSSEFAGEKIRAALDGVPQVFEWQPCRADGTPFDVEVTLSRLELGGERCLQAIVRDTSERKRNESILRESEAMLQQSQRVAHLGHYIFDIPAGRWSSSAVLDEVFGIDRDHPRDVAGWLQIVHAEQREEMAGYLRDHVLRDRKPFDREYRIARPSDGAVRWVHVLGNLELDAAGRLVKMFGTVQDITDRKEAAEALKASEAKYRRLYNETPVLLHSIDRNGVLVEVNDHWLKTLGYERHEVVGRRVTDFFSEASRKHATEVVQPSFFRDGVAKDVPYQFVKKNGDVVDVLLSATGVRDAEGKVVVSQAVIEDITERKRAEERSRKYSADLQRLLSVSREMTATTDLARLYRSSVQTAVDLLGFDFSTVMVLSEDKTGLTVMDAIGFPRSMIGHYGLVKGQGLSTYVVESKRPDAVVDFREETRFEIPAVVDDFNLRSALCVPMMIGDEVFGVLIGHTLERREFSREDIAIYENIGNQAAIAIRSALNLQSLGKSERMLQTIIDAEPACVKLLDRDANLILMNRAGLDMIQVDSLDEVKGRCVCPMIGTKDRDAFLDLTRRVFQGVSGTLVFEMTGVKGRRLWLETHAVPLRNEKDEIIAVLGVTRDVTARKQADEALRESEERFRDLAESLPLTVFEMDLQGRFTYVNRAALEKFGYSKQDFEAGLFMAQVISPEDLDRAREVMARRLAGDEEGYVEYRGMRKDGSMFPVTVASSAILHDGRPVGLRGIVSDLTERRELEEERLKTQKLESIGTLAGGIAHDFNNLLQGVFGYLSMARLTFDKREKSLSMLEQAEKALHQAMGLTSQLLTFSKGGKPVRQRISLVPIIENAAKFALSGSRCECRLDIEPGLWMVDGDGGQLGQVIQNIVLNADQAMPLGGAVTVTARNVPGDDPALPQGLAKRDQVMVSVQDNGVGIPANYLLRIFDPYFTTKDKGSGLGLATSYSIVRNHDGVITARSEQGAGSLFTLWLPSAGPGEEQHAASSAFAASRKGRILVMDDDEFVRSVAVESLRELGHDVEVAAHGDEAVERYCRAGADGCPFDVVILDLTVRGGKGGLQTLLKLRELDPAVKAVVSTGYSNDAIASEYRKHGFRAFLKKPYDLSTLSEVLDSLLS
jgi:two-component system cell cycle sensor histidine kinase/response regulator CckA